MGLDRCVEVLLTTEVEGLQTAIAIDLIGYFVGNQGFDSGLTGTVDELLSKPQASHSLFTR
jgi:hypothetical protein